MGACKISRRLEHRQGCCGLMLKTKKTYVKAWLCYRTWYVGVVDMMGAKGMIEGNEIGNGKSYWDQRVWDVMLQA